MLMKEREIREHAPVDVFVAGSGPAGFAAAVAAGRQGKKVMIVEQCGMIGGVSTAGLMSHFTGTVTSKLYDETLKRQAEFEGRDENAWLGTINPEVLKAVYLEMLTEAGVEIRLYTFLADVVTDGRQVKGAVIVSKSGFEYVPAKVFIDGTGDGDLAEKAGAEYFKGRETDGLMQPVTLMFKLGGVDYGRAIFPPSFETTVDVPKGEIQALAKKNMTPPLGHVLLYSTTLPGVVTVNMTNLTGIDGTNVEDLTKAEIICRKQMFEICDFLREYAPGYENCYILTSASLMGVRETRHFIGDKSITREDIETARRFDDWAVRGAHFNFDVHNITGSGLDETGVQHKFKQQSGYTIPYGCMIPVGFDNLLLAGRCISGSHIAHSNFRAMPICLALGEAAGVAASLAVDGGVGVRDIDLKQMQSILE